MILQKNSFLWFKFNGLYRYLLSHFFSKSVPYIIINEYPKSGGSWIGDMISEILEIPFPRNRLPILGRSILHGHMLHSWNMNNILLVWRDGRDILISQYYHSLFENERGNSYLVNKTRSYLNFKDYRDIHKNLPKFMEYTYETCKHPKFSWKTFVDKWTTCSNCINLKYEDLRTDPINELQRVIYELIGEEINFKRIKKVVHRHSFENLTGRKVGEEDKSSFLRKGIVGDWKNYFSRDLACLFNEYAGDCLVKLKYEEDLNWPDIYDYLH